MITLKTEKEPKMKFFDFGAFQKIRKILSREKYIFHMRFGASHGTPRIILGIMMRLFNQDISVIHDI